MVRRKTSKKLIKELSKITGLIIGQVKTIENEMYFIKPLIGERYYYWKKWDYLCKIVIIYIVSASSKEL